MEHFPSAVIYLAIKRIVIASHAIVLQDADLGGGLHFHKCVNVYFM
jgi:hypothetical protein